MIRILLAAIGGLATVFACGNVRAADEPVAGTTYMLVEPPQPTSTGDKIEVLEVFSFACPACNAFQPAMAEIKKSLPADAEVRYLPASFRSDEDWPVFQRAFFTAQALGIEDKSHQAMFDAVWKDKTLAIYDESNRKLVDPLPDINAIARFYAKFGVKPADFVATAGSFAINTKMKRADEQIKAYGVDSTPTVIVNGKYRVTPRTAGGWDQMVSVVEYLVHKEQAAK